MRITPLIDVRADSVRAEREGGGEKWTCARALPTLLCRFVFFWFFLLNGGLALNLFGHGGLGLDYFYWLFSSFLFLII